MIARRDLLRRHEALANIGPAGNDHIERAQELPGELGVIPHQAAEQRGQGFIGGRDGGGGGHGVRS